LILQIISLEQRIFTTVKFKRWNMMPFAESAVKSRCGFDPLPLKIKFCKTVINEKVTPHEFDKLLCGKMITDICETNTGRNAAGSSQGTEEGGLGYAKTPATLEHIACTIMLGEIKRRIRVVKYPISDGKIKLHGDLDGVCTSIYSLDGIISDTLMITVNNGCWSQIRQMLLVHPHSPSKDFFRNLS